MFKNNQLENQVENQVDLNLKKLENENEENIVCNIYKEQFDLINILPENERLKVLYLAVLNAFYDYDKKNQDNQLENQLDYTYISSSIYNSLTNYSKKLIKLLMKTIICKNYKNWGGKRKNSGRRKKDDVSIPDNCKLYGEYNNVYLSEEQHSKLLGICLDKGLLDEIINDLSKSIETGKEEPYRADFPNAHFVRLKAYYDYRRKFPDRFKEPEPKTSQAFNDFYEREKARMKAEGYIVD